jgi:hypothetical protein
LQPARQLILIVRHSQQERRNVLMGRAYAIFSLSFFTAVGPLPAAGADDARPPAALPEAAAMFERLVRRIPADVDPLKAHEYVGQEFHYVLHAGNTANEETALVPFLVGGRLYCLHCLRTRTPALTVYRIDNPPATYGPRTDYAKNLVATARGRWPAVALAADLHAVLDGKAGEAVKIERVLVFRTGGGK